MNQSAMVTVPCQVTVAAGVFAPGHLGELTRYLPFELVDDVLEMTGAVQNQWADNDLTALAAGTLPANGSALHG